MRTLTFSPKNIKDFYIVLAARKFKCTEKEVTPEMRMKAKQDCFAFIYGKRFDKVCLKSANLREDEKCNTQ
jgi:DNA polymerase I-like protein with 3'-5' exonuclease and polymerase domains